MRKSPIALLCLCVLLILNKVQAQQSIFVTGNIKNSLTKENLSAVSVVVKGSSLGTYTDEKGNFKLVTSKTPPFTVVITSIGYFDTSVSIESANQSITIELKPSYALGQDIVVAASRLPERILESPVTIDRINANAMRNTAGPNYYDALNNIKGVDVVTSSYTFKTISTRGFNGSGNLRCNQLVDGMDNSAPALNFSVGNVIGITDLDVDNMELLSGASSALYGSGGMNGTLLITSKDPFKYQGFSIEAKEGIMHINDYRHPASPLHDFTFRWGKKVSDKFAFKIGAEYTKANDWQADDSTDLLRNNVISNVKTGNNTTRATDPNYDGVNVYGDEASAGMGAFANVYQEQTRLGVLKATNGTFDIVQYMDAYLPKNPTMDQINTFIANLNTFDPSGNLAKAGANLIPFNLGLRNSIYGNKAVSRTGYNEKNLVDYNSYDFKISGGLYYKLSSNTEASLTGNWGQGTTVYTGADRYSLKNFKIGQYKLEFKNPQWFLRAYTTQENSGDSYAQTLTALSINNAWKDNSTWFGEYIGAYSNVYLKTQNDALANANARAFADQGRFLPGTTEYNNAFNKAVTTPISQGGSQFADKSSLYQFEGQYNFSQFVKVFDLLVGADYRTYHLNSHNTIFYEPNGPVNIGEYGAYAQIQKALLDDVLKLSVSGRYDKNENFKGRFTPRATATIKVAKDNNIRLSYQQAYRFPNNQDQYINLFTPGATLIGCLPVFNTLYNFSGNPIYTASSIQKYRDDYAKTGMPDTSELAPANFGKTEPESMSSYEIGYRGVVNSRWLIDVYYYYSRYKNFIGHEAVGRGISGNPSTSKMEILNPLTTANYSYANNSPTPVNATGYGIGLSYQFDKGYVLSGNVYGDQLTGIKSSDFVSFFNTPKTRFNLGLSNANVTKSIGFNIAYKWQAKTYWEGTFGTGEIPAFGSLDAQVSYHFIKQNVLLKIGGTNITNHYYRNAFGNPYIGGLYYISLGYNIF